MIEPFFDQNGVRLLVGDCRERLRDLAAESVQCCVTSPPYYGLRDYGMADQIGIETDPDEYVAELVSVFREVRRALRDDGSLWLNLGDSFANDSKWGGETGGKHARGLHAAGGMGRGKKHTGLKPKELIGIPWMVAFAMRADGWLLREDVIWAKPNPMPESVVDRCTRAHEYLFHFVKQPHYFHDNEAIREPATFGDHRRNVDSLYQAPGQPKHLGLHRAHPDHKHETRNKRSVWSISPEAFEEAHFATMPTKLVEPCILASTKPGDLVLDPFFGAGTVGVVANRFGRSAVGVELNPAYCEIAANRLRDAMAQGRLAL